MRVGGTMLGLSTSLTLASQKQNSTSYQTDKEKTQKSAKSVITDEMRQMLRSMQQTAETNKRAMEKKQMDKFKNPTSKSLEEKLLTQSKYNYKDVSTKIQQAKTSTSAGQAVISAKRKVAEIKRKMSSGKEDAKELQLALTHAKRMEMVARKKKHHLELEELVEHTSKQDERLDKAEETISDIRYSLAEQAEDKITDAEDAIFDAREELLDEGMELVEESEALSTQDMEESLAQLNEMVAQFGEEELKELEESMELMETMEVIDPHMSEEDLEELKRKHRNSEMKAMVKADMDYLKEMIKYTMQKGASIPGMPSGGTSDVMPVTIAEPETTTPVSIDITV